MVKRDVGVPGRMDNPLRYQGPTDSVVPCVEFPRIPTTTDKRYPLLTQVRIGRNPVSGTEGDVWQLTHFDSSGDAQWKKVDFIGGDSSVDGPATSTNNAVARWDGTTGTQIQDSSVLIDDSDAMSGVTQLDVDNIRVDGNSVSSTNTNGNILIDPNGTGGVVATTNLTVGVDSQDVNFTVNGAAVNATIMAEADNASSLGGIVIKRHSDSAGFGGHKLSLRSRGDHVTPTAVQSGDTLSLQAFAGYDGTDYALSSQILAQVDGTPGANDMPGRIIMSTSPDGTQVPVEGFRLDKDQVVTLANALPVASGGTGQTSYINGQLLIGNSTGNTLDKATISSTDFVNVTNGSGSITLGMDEDFQRTGKDGWNGSILETASFTVTSNGSTITASVELSGGGDLTVVFSDGYYMWDTTPAATVSLTAGTDTVPVLNYVYLLQSTKTLTASTSGWPATEHAPIGTVLCQSASSLQTQGAYKVHAWTDHVTKTNQQGHIGDLNFWIRQQNGTWQSGVAQTYSISGASPNEVLLTTTAGVVLQLHEKEFPAFSGTPTYYVVNDSTTPYTTVTDLNALNTDSTGASLTGKYYSLVIWGCVSEDTGDCKLFVNLPSGSYNNATSAQEDASKFTNFTIPTAFKGTGFLISRWTLRNQSNTTYTSIEEVDLRGFEPSITPGGTTAVPTEFDDSAFRVFDNSDNTKKLAFQCSGITTATTRTLTVPNANGTIPVSFPGDSGSATPTSAGAVTIAGGAGITTSSSGNTVTIANTNAGNGEWVYIGSATASASTTLTFTSLIDGTFDHHVLVVRNLIFSSTNTGLGFNVSTNNGSSYITSGYLSGCHHHAYTSAADTNASSTTNVRLTGNGGTTRPCSLIMHMWDLFDASSYPTFSWAGTYMTDGSIRHIMEGGALYNAASSVNAFRLSVSAGNMVSGEAILYGINES